jgi:hypothetical protein
MRVRWPVKGCRLNPHSKDHPSTLPLLIGKGVSICSVSSLKEDKSAIMNLGLRQIDNTVNLSKMN